MLIHFYRMMGQPSESSIRFMLFLIDILRLLMLLLFTECLKPSDHFSNLECAMKPVDINYGIDNFMRFSHRILPNTCIFERNNGDIIRADCINGLRYLPGTIVPSYYIDCVITSSSFLFKLKECAITFCIPIITIQLVRYLLKSMFSLSAIYMKYRIVSIDEIRDTTCLICMDEIQNLACMHECRNGFHEDCIKEWNNMSQYCPLCRG